MLIIFLLIFFGLQAFVLFCCIAAGDDPVSQDLSDQEQMEFLKAWKEKNMAKN